MKIVIIDHNSTMIPEMGIMIDEALIAHRNGHTVTFITCGACLDSCYSNPTASKIYCRVCVKDYKSSLAPFLDERFKHFTLKDYQSAQLAKAVEEFKYEFNSLEDLKKIYFRGIDVGYSTLSSFISNTRNMNPEMTPFTREILIKSLRAAVRQAALCEEILNREAPDKVLIYNGRMPENRPVLRFFREKNIDVEVHEDYPTSLRGTYKKLVYPNSMPHSISLLQKNLEEEWRKNPEGAQIGERFFQNRRNAAFAGDKVYTKDQKKGLLPEGWNPAARNIVIFNSSEDEFYAIGGEWEEKLFPSQIDGIKHIFDLVERYPNCEVYLRVHPNLRPIPFKYHMDLYSLSSHPRVHVIRADSEVSTYALVDAASVVVSFGTSVGVEAAYADKPVVLLGASYYKGLGFCYEPETITEMDKLIFEAELKSLKNLNVIKYGNYIMCNKGKDFSFYNFNCFQFKIGNHYTPNVAMIDQSKTTMSKLKSFVMRVWRELQRRYLKARIPEA